MDCHTHTIKKIPQPLFATGEREASVIMLQLQQLCKPCGSQQQQ